MANAKEPSIERLFSLFSHELYTRITSLQGALWLLRRQPLNDRPEVGQLLDLAAESADHLTRAIENILDWYGLSHGRDFLFLQPGDGADALRQAVQTLQPLADERQIRISLDILESIPLVTDERYLRRAFRGLLHNAIKFSPRDGQIWVTVTIVPSEEGPGAAIALFSIADRGVGIAREDIGRLFKPFQQIDSSDTREYGGLGLELAICHEIIRQHGGRIHVESVVGRGSTFYVALPMDVSRVL
ncbi:HAMP domain-containing sensor histidine kinase [Pannus brasiliensis]|uniref:sensor histidine kinase n=1 Tax=Pannus brasiliensis TaxID=1579216 RepID=UPI002FCD6BDA